MSFEKLFIIFICYYVDLLRSSHIDLQTGILFESGKQIYSYIGYIHVPVSYSIPNMIHLPNSPCLNDSLPQKILHLYEQEIKEIKYMLPSVESAHTVSYRRKRFVGTILAGLSSGLSLYNRYSIESLKNTVKRTEESIDKIIKTNEALVRNTRIVYDRLGYLEHTVSKTFDYLITRLNDTICYAQEMMMMSTVFTELNIHIIQEYKDILNLLLQRAVTPEIISYSVLTNMALEYPEIKKTLELISPLTLYKILSSNLVYISSSDLTLVYILSIPVLTNRTSSILYNTYTVPWGLNDTYEGLLDLPNTVALTDELQVAWMPNKDKCTWLDECVLCDVSELSNNENICVTNLLYHSDHQSCNRLIRQRKDVPVHHVTDSGLLIGSYTNAHLTIGWDEGLPSKLLPLKSDIPMLLSSENGSFVTIQGQVYRLTHQNVNIIRPVPNITDTLLEYLTPRLSEDLIEFTPIENLLSTDHPHITPTSSCVVCYSIAIIILLYVMLRLFLIRQLIKNYIISRVNRLHDRSTGVNKETVYLQSLH